MIALNDIYQPIHQNLVSVEDRLKGMSSTNTNIFAKGKRLRPALLLFAAHAFNGADHKNVALVATAIEMIHTASLIHDDIIDSSTQRRNKPTLYQCLGIKPAVIFADFLFVEGLTMLESVKPSNIMPSVVRAVKTMCEGQWMELTLTSQNDYSEQNYMEVIEKKTASLIFHTYLPIYMKGFVQNLFSQFRLLTEKSPVLLF
jgi:heptaprenyl diphosphate synthase